MPNWLARLLGRLFPAPVPLPQPPAPKPHPVPAPVPMPPAPPPSPTADEVVAAINAERAKFGLGPLSIDPGLMRIAQEWSEQMAKADTLAHGNFAARITSVHPRVAAGEDVAEGYSDAASVVVGWMKSPPHRANILGRFSHIGVGVGTSRNRHIYWTCDFCLLTAPVA